MDPAKSSTAGVDTPDEISWPINDADLPRLFVPREWSGPDDRHCKIKYDGARKMLMVVDDDNSILDIINPADIIGCELEIKLEEHPASAQNVCNENENPEASKFDNVPKSRIPIDSQGTAFLTIYAYPKKDLSQSKSWLAYFGFGGTHNDPNPHFPSTVGPFGNRQARHRSFRVAPAEDLIQINTLVRAIRKLSGLSDGPRKLLVVLNPTAGTGKGRSALNDIARPMLLQAGVELEIFETTHPLHAKDRAMKDDIASFDGFVLMGGDGTIHEFLQGIYEHQNAEALAGNIKLGVIGCGSGNGLAKSLNFAANEEHSYLASTFMIAKNQSTKVDLSKYETTTKQYNSFLTFSWAMIADVDISSEYIRFLGDIRFDICTAWKVVALRTYQARLSYLSPSKHDKKITIGEAMPKLTDPIPDHWDVIDDKFILFWASQVTHAGGRVYQSPPSSIHDGVFQILVIRGSWSRYRIIMLFLGIENGTHINSPAAEFIECVAYRLEATTAGSCNVLDGELIETGPVQGYVMPGAINMFCQVPS